MKIKIENYTFDASAKTVTLTDYPALRLDSILLITNVTDNVIIYNFADANLGGTVSGGTLTLDYDTTSMADTDSLLIYIDDLDAVQLVGSSTLATSANQQTDALTDAELRASAVPISGEVSLDLTGTDLATQTTLSSVDSNVNAIDTKVGSIDSKLTDNSQTSQIVNSTGDAVTVTGNKLDVNASIDTTGLALETKQDDLITAIGALPQDQALTDTQLRATAVEVSATALDVRPLVNTDVVTAELSAVDNAVLDTIAAKDFATQTTLSEINAKLVTGTDIGDVTINNGAGAAAVNIQDGGNAITVDYATTGSGTATGALRVELPTNGTGVIATVGAVTAITNALPAGTNAIGKLIPPDYDVTSHTAKAQKYYTNSGAVTDGIVWSPAAGKRWHIVSMIINVSADATVTLEDDLAAGDNVVWKGEISAKSGFVANFSEMYPLASGEDAADLLVTTTAGNIYITITGYEI